MRIFIDSADLCDIEHCWDTGLVDGVTTNPTLIRQCGLEPDYVYKSLCKLGVDDISMEVMGDYEEMINEATRLDVEYGHQATIKLPMTRDGLKVCESLSNDEGPRTNVTLIFNAAQAMLAAKAGATYVSPFVGRIDDCGYAGLEVVRSIAQLYRNTGSNTQVLAASIRTPHRAVRSFFNGADVVTMPPSVFWKCYDHILTDKGLEIFDRDAGISVD